MFTPKPDRHAAGTPPFVLLVVALWIAVSLALLWRLKPADPLAGAAALCRSAAVAPASPMASEAP